MFFNCGPLLMRDPPPPPPPPPRVGYAIFFCWKHFAYVGSTYRTREMALGFHGKISGFRMLLRITPKPGARL